jgi:hypothetical protein
MPYTAEIFQNAFLPDGGTQVDAIVTVTADAESTGRTSGTDATEVIIIDASGSMSEPGRMPAARHAAKAAVDCIRDGVRFAIIAGNNSANQIYPPYAGQLAVASAETRAQATDVIGRLQPSGGTEMGRWLMAASRLFASRPGDIAHAILLTDGENGENQGMLERVLATIGGQFQCDCRGVGTDWVVSELRKIADAMLGTIDIVADPADLTADFEKMMTSAMGKVAANIQLKVWTPAGATVRFVKQVEPTLVDLTTKRVDAGPRVGLYPTGSWGTESRDYHVCVDVTAGNVGDEMLAARVTVVEGDQDLAKGMIKAVWTDDTALSTRINKQVAHYTGQADLAAAIQEGLEAHKAGDVDTATQKLGKAVKLATETGNTEAAELLAKVVDIDDPVTGTVRVKKKVAAADEMALDTRSTKTVRARRAQ